MKRGQVLVISSTGCSAVAVILFICLAVGNVQAAPWPQTDPATPTPEPVSTTPGLAIGVTCVDPTPRASTICAEQSERLLASTVRLELHGPGGGIGHATVIDGRYLITHNHFPISSDDLRRGGAGLVKAVSVFKANGEGVLLGAPLSSFKVVGEAPEVLVLDFMETNGVGLFERAGVASVAAGTWETLGLRTGSEVAQVDWDGSAAVVRWTRVKAIHTEGNTPYIELESAVTPGSSGGGVFSHGCHVANNWSRTTIRIPGNGTVVNQFSTAALDTAALIP